MMLDAGWWAGVSGIASILALIGASIAVWQVFDGFSSKPASGLHSNVTHRSVDGMEDIVEVLVSVRMMGAGTMYEVSWLTNMPLKPDHSRPSMTCDSDPMEYSWKVRRDLVEQGLVGITWVEPRYGRPVRRAERWAIDLEARKYERWVHPWFPAVTSRLGARGRWKETTRGRNRLSNAEIPPIDG